MANNIHPTAIIGDDVQLGDDNVIGPYTVISGRTTIGDGNWIGASVAIGMPPEVYGYPHGPVWDESGDTGSIVIGDRNVIHEFVSIQLGWAEQTRVGSDCFLMTKSHVGHDCVVDDRVTLSCASLLGGHTRVWTAANVGMNSVIHQRMQIGPGAMVGMGSAVRRVVPPFSITLGNPARTSGINTVGLERNGLDAALVEPMTDYLLGRGELPDGVPDRLRELLSEWSASQQSDDH